MEPNEGQNQQVQGAQSLQNAPTSQQTPVPPVAPVEIKAQPAQPPMQTVQGQPQPQPNLAPQQLPPVTDFVGYLQQQQAQNPQNPQNPQQPQNGQAPQQGAQPQQPQNGQTQQPQAPARPLTTADLPELINALQQNGQPQVDPRIQQDAEFARQIYQNPEVLNAVQSAIQEPQSSGPEFVPLPKPPKPPVKPAGFSIADAEGDPTSPSGQYRQDLLRYQEESAQFNIATAEANAKNNQRQLEYNQEQQQKIEQARQEQLQQQQLLAQQRQNMQSVYQNLTTKHAMQAADAKELIEFTLSGGFEKEPDLMIEAWKIRKARQLQQNPQAPHLQQQPQIQQPQPMAPVQTMVQSPAAVATNSGLQQPQGPIRPRTQVEQVKDFFLQQSRAKRAHLGPQPVQQAA